MRRQELNGWIWEGLCCVVNHLTIHILPLVWWLLSINRLCRHYLKPWVLWGNRNRPGLNVSVLAQHLPHSQKPHILLLGKPFSSSPWDVWVSCESKETSWSYSDGKHNVLSMMICFCPVWNRWRTPLQLSTAEIQRRFFFPYIDGHTSAHVLLSNEQVNKYSGGEKCRMLITWTAATQRASRELTCKCHLVWF